MLKAPHSVQELERVRRFDARTHPLHPPKSAHLWKRISSAPPPPPERARARPSRATPRASVSGDSTRARTRCAPKSARFWKRISSATPPPPETTNARAQALLLLLASASALKVSGRRAFFKTAATAAAAAPAAALATYTGKPGEKVPKFLPPPENGSWNTLYATKKLTLEKKSPVDRIDLAPPGFKTYKNTYPGLFGKQGVVTAPDKIAGQKAWYKGP